MKFVLLVHSTPRPWGHPTGDFVAAHQALPAEQRARMEADFDALLTELVEGGELVGGEPLGDPASARLYRWVEDAPVEEQGPYVRTPEQLAGFFVLDVADEARAQEVASRFAGPGETVELRPVAQG